jgi:hypothetical protein
MQGNAVCVSAAVLFFNILEISGYYYDKGRKIKCA